MRILFLDDSMARWEIFKKNSSGHTVKWASFYNEAVRLVNDEDSFDLIYLDHDLADADFDAPTGYTFAKYMIDNNIKAKYVICHSMNPVGRRNMFNILKNSGYEVVEVDHAWTHEPAQVMCAAFNVCK